MDFQEKYNLTARTKRGKRDVIALIIIMTLFIAFTIIFR